MTVQTPTSSQAGAPGELPKQYRPAEHESRIWGRWEASDAFHADPARVLPDRSNAYCILIPPPNVTARLHLGHALTYTLQDVLTRFHRLLGFETLWMPGTDHAAIATQAVVERRLLKEEGKRRTDFTREQFVARVQAYKDEYEAEIIGQLKRMGASCDWRRVRYTMDEVCNRAVYEAFFRLFKDGLIYRGKRLVNWDPVLQTAVAEDECYDEEIEGQFYYLRYPLVHPHGATTQRERRQGASPPDDAVPVTWSELESRGYPGAESHPDEEQAYVTVATTRPETYLGDTAVAVNPHDPRAKALRGLCVELPLVGRVIPIVEDAYVVLPSAESPWGKGLVLPGIAEGETEDPKAAFATGFLKVTPAHDPNDYELYQRHKEVMDRFQGGTAHGGTALQSGGSALINIFAPDATISDKHGWTDVKGAHIFVGKTREEARKLAVSEFKARTVAGGSTPLLAEIRPYRHSVKHSDRSKAIVEPYLSDQWYVKVTDPRMAGAANAALAPEQRSHGGTALRAVCSTLDPEQRSLGLRAVCSTDPLVAVRAIDARPYPPIRPEGFVGRDPYPSGQPSPRSLVKSQRYLPHLELPDATYFVTWNTEERRMLDGQERDAVLASLQYFDGKTMDLSAAVVMPDHLHAVVRFREGTTLKEWEASVKRFTAREINKDRGEHGSLWQAEGFDHIIRDGHYLSEFLQYIAENPVEAGLVLKPSEYRWTYVAPGVLAELERRSHGSESRATIGSGSGNGDGSLRFYPARYAKTYEQWHDNIRDWCISRQLWWGQRIPVWTFTFDERSAVAGLQGAVSEIEHAFGEMARELEIDNDLWLRLDTAAVLPTGYLCPRTSRARRALGLIATLFSREPEEAATEYADLGMSGRALKAAGELSYAMDVIGQDPDVLDTWFSSGMWPMSTMGWPDPKAAGPEFPGLLEAFNPTSVLCTAREIITLWVSRMVMFNRYFMPLNGDPHGSESRATTGRVPFRDVFIHAVIQDGEGRKMSKTLGNGVDPVDIIESHGADALRFTLCHMTTQTQDVRMPVVKDPTTGKNTSPKFDIGRNFANKLWNAARFAIGILEAGRNGDVPSAPDRQPPAAGEGELSLVDRWMLSRLRAGVEECSAALRAYEFSDYAQSLYRLVWDDFCDWYLEAVKPTVAGDPLQRAVLRNTLDALLRLAHPAMPFITEAIYERVGSLRAGDAPFLTLGPPRKGNLLATAGWPVVSAEAHDEKVERHFARLQSLVTAIREVKAQHQVNPKRRITLHATAGILDAIEPVSAAVHTVAGLERATTDAPAGESVAFRFESLELRLSNLADAVDAGAERARLEKLIADLEKSIRTLSGRLANPGYAERAPAPMVQQTRDQLAKAQADLGAARESLAKLGA